jgi:N-methylhydantoinase A/oxoprolinase/acetone carboxylase beta subunit
MRLGIDVGGTNTDAVLMAGREVIASTKQSTTEDIATGIVNAIHEVLLTSGVLPGQIEAVMIGTTQFTNAFVERRGLNSVAAIRLSLPGCQAIPPMSEWPEDLAAAIGEQWYLTPGGYEYDGREIAPLDELDIVRVGQDIHKKGIKSIAISSVFAPVNDAMERRAADILRQHVPGCDITLSSSFGRLGLLERENAAIMNASLTGHAEKVVSSFEKALQELEIHAPFYLTQNDGTLMQAEVVRELPIMTFSSGPTNSMRGAAWLAGVSDALVVDIGGTTSDLGFLSNGFPRESSLNVDIGGVRTNFRMPDVLAIGLGGGSEVKMTAQCQIGPQSVGFRLKEKALVFGGDTLTTTDLAIAGGLADFGNQENLSALSRADVEQGLSAIREKLEDAIDRMKTRPGDVDVILVGGGSILVDENLKLKGVGRVYKPEHFSVANAIGAAIAQVGGEIDKVFSYEETPRDQVLAQAKREATELAIQSGAVKASVKLLELEELPLAYLPNGAVRVRAKAIGDMAFSAN